MVTRARLNDRTVLSKTEGAPKPPSLELAVSQNHRIARRRALAGFNCAS